MESSKLQGDIKEVVRGPCAPRGDLVAVAAESLWVWRAAKGWQDVLEMSCCPGMPCPLLPCLMLRCSLLVVVPIIKTE